MPVSASAAADRRAASLVASAFNSVFEDDPTVHIAVRTPNGSTVSAVATLGGDYRAVFDPEDLGALLDRLAQLLDRQDPLGVLAVHTPHSVGGWLRGWAWTLAEGHAPLDYAAAFHPSVLDERKSYPYFPDRLANNLTDDFGDRRIQISVAPVNQAQFEQRGLQLDPWS